MHLEMNKQIIYHNKNGNERETTLKLNKWLKNLLFIADIINNNMKKCLNDTMLIV